MQIAAFSFLLAMAATTVCAQQEVVKVTVGKNGLTYDPPTLHAEIGAKIQFDFFPKNHSVVQSSFADPCHPLANGGFFSGFVPTKEGPSDTTFTIEVKDKKPIWFYCAQGNHCQSGMVGAINAPESGNTFAKFAQLAKQATNSTVPPTGPAGGILSNGSDGSDGSTSTNTPASECSLPPSQTTAAPMQSSTPWTTQPYTSTWTTNGQTFTTTATTTQFSEVPAQSDPPKAAGAAGSFGSIHARVLAAVAAIAML